MLTSLLLLLCVITGYTQEDWVKREIYGGIFVKFPSEPQYKLMEEGAMYLCKNDEHIFIALVQRNIIPNYANFINLPETEKRDVINTLLDNAVKGKLAYTNSSGTPSNITLGKYIGRSISYSAINPATGQPGLIHSKMFIVNDKMLSFDCMELKSTTSSSSRYAFLNSITIENVLTHYLVKSDRAYFYNTADYSTRSAGFLLKGEIVSSINEENGFIYVIFTNAKGITSKGWISKKDLKFYN